MSPEAQPRPEREKRVLVVGAGTRFLSAMTYYTIRVTNALATRFCVVALPMRQMIPTFLYPGADRVGRLDTHLRYDPSVRVLSGADWYWGLGLVRNLRLIRAWRPDVIVFEWWTGTVLHTYLAVAVVGRLLGASIIVEFHEVLDSSEDRMPLARAWVSLLGRAFFRMVSGFVIHSEEDRAPLERRYGLGGKPWALIHHGPFDHHLPADGAVARRSREAPPGAINLLFLGVIRPYKGLEDLVDAFGMLDAEEAERFWLTIVGETWQGWNVPAERIRANRHRARITFVNRFVDDDEVATRFGAADAVVLPYHRSSASGPAHIAMSAGLPLITTAVGGLPNAVADYEGAIVVAPSDPAAIRDAIRRLPEMVGRHYRDPHSWERTASGFAGLIERVQARRGSGGRLPGAGSERVTTALSTTAEEIPLEAGLPAREPATRDAAVGAEAAPTSLTARGRSSRHIQ